MYFARICGRRVSEASPVAMVSECKVIKVSCLAMISGYGNPEVTYFTKKIEGEVAKGSHFARICGHRVSKASHFAMVCKCKIVKASCCARITEHGSPQVSHFAGICECEVGKGLRFAGIRRCKVSGAACFAIIPERKMIAVTVLGSALLFLTVK